MTQEMLWMQSENTAFVYDDELGNDSSDRPIIYVANLQSSAHLALENSGAVIWELLEKPVQLGELITQVAKIFHQNPQEVEPTIVEFLNNLVNLGFVTQS